MANVLELMRDPRLKLAFEQVRELQEKVGTGKWTLKKPAPELDERFPLEWLGQRATLGVHASASALIHEAAFEQRIFDTGAPLAAPRGHSLAQLHLRAGFGLDSKGQVPLSRPLGQLSFSGALGGEISYHHLLPVPQSRKRIDALRSLAAASQLIPSHVDLRRLVPGQAHVYRGWFQVDLGLEVALGSDVALEEMIEIFDVLRSPITLHVRATARAGLGWSVYREMNLALASSQNRPRWARIRLERSEKRRLSVGASVDLNVKYDLATPAEKLLDHALRLDATVEVFETLERVDALFAGGWTNVKQNLEDRLAERLGEWVEDAGWRDWLANSDEVRALTQLARRIVESYDRLDREVADRVRALWADVLDFTQLRADTRLRRALESIAEFDPNNIDLGELLGEQEAEVIEFLEILTGKNFEELLFDERLRATLTRAKQAAEKILAVADETPADLVARFRRFKERSGAEAVASFLRRNATSKDRLERAIDRQIQPRIRRLAERLVDKVWDRIDQDDLDRIQSWALRLEQFLRDRDRWEAEVREAIGKLRGEYGYSLSLEIDRVTETTALVDLEIDPRHVRTRRAVMTRLEHGKVAEVLAALPDPGEDARENELHWHINEGLFTSRRVRTGTLNLLSTLSGPKTHESQRVQESTIRVTNRGRTAEYGAGFTRSLKAGAADPRSSRASARWLVHARGTGTDISRPYEEVSDELHLSFERIDGKTLAEEVAALDMLMSQFGFARSGSQPIETAVRERLAGEALDVGLNVPPGVPLPLLDSRFSAEVRLPGDCLDLLVDARDEAEWNLDFLNAAHRWLEEPLIVERLRSQNVRRAGALAGVLRHPEFHDKWTNAERFREQAGPRFRIQVGPQPVEVEVLRRRGGRPGLFNPDFNPLARVIDRRKPALRAMRRALPVVQQAVSRARPETLDDALRKVSRAFKSAGVVKSWPNPAFVLWLALARSSERMDLYAQARGAAVFQWRLAPGEDFRVHAWTLSGGIPDLRRTDVFPF